MGCRLAKAQQWCLRIHHEAQLHQYNTFLTLTFADEHLPDTYSVDPRDVQLFIKRLRKEVGKLRYFAVGEYGGKTERPHYHLIIFGYDFPDKKPAGRGSRGDVLYQSATLAKVWPFGLHWIGNVTWQSAGYVAQYVTKKITGDMAEGHYTRQHPLTRQTVKVRPEFTLQSRKPGLAADWFAKYKDDAYPSDFVIVEGRKIPIPRYYDKLLEREDPARHAKLKAERKAEAPGYEDEENTTIRLMTKDESKRLEVKRKTRSYEDQN